MYDRLIDGKRWYGVPAGTTVVIDQSTTHGTSGL
jgi:hypothetical protein